MYILYIHVQNSFKITNIQIAEYNKMYFTQNLIFYNLERNQDSKLSQNFISKHKLSKYSFSH